jgi:hypothetical protein
MQPAPLLNPADIFRSAKEVLIFRLGPPTRLSSGLAGGTASGLIAVFLLSSVARIGREKISTIKTFAFSKPFGHPSALHDRWTHYKWPSPEEYQKKTPGKKEERKFIIFCKEKR